MLGHYNKSSLKALEFRCKLTPLTYPAWRAEFCDNLLASEEYGRAIIGTPVMPKSYPVITDFIKNKEGLDSLIKKYQLLDASVSATTRMGCELHQPYVDARNKMYSFEFYTAVVAHICSISSLAVIIARSRECLHMKQGSNRHEVFAHAVQDGCTRFTHHMEDKNKKGFVSIESLKVIVYLQGGYYQLIFTTCCGSPELKSTAKPSEPALLKSKFFIAQLEAKEVNLSVEDEKELVLCYISCAAKAKMTFVEKASEPFVIISVSVPDDSLPKLPTVGIPTLCFFQLAGDYDTEAMLRQLQDSAMGGFSSIDNDSYLAASEELFAGSILLHQPIVYTPPLYLAVSGSTRAVVVSIGSTSKDQDTACIPLDADQSSTVTRSYLTRQTGSNSVPSSTSFNRYTLFNAAVPPLEVNAVSELEDLNLEYALSMPLSPALVQLLSESDTDPMASLLEGLSSGHFDSDSSIEAISFIGDVSLQTIVNSAQTGSTHAQDVLIIPPPTDEVMPKRFFDTILSRPSNRASQSSSSTSINRFTPLCSAHHSDSDSSNEQDVTYTPVVCALDVHSSSSVLKLSKKCTPLCRDDSADMPQLVSDSDSESDIFTKVKVYPIRKRKAKVRKQKLVYDQSSTFLSTPIADTAVAHAGPPTLLQQHDPSVWINEMVSSMSDLQHSNAFSHANETRIVQPSAFIAPLPANSVGPWFLDSGASLGVTNDMKQLIDLEPITPFSIGGINGRIMVTHRGRIP